MPIKCLNCYGTFDDLEAYYRHNREHEIDEGVSFDPDPTGVPR